MQGARFLWDDIKHNAREYSRSSRPLPLDFEARMWLLSQMAKQFSFERLPEGTNAFYEAELAAMVATFRENTWALANP